MGKQERLQRNIENSRSTRHHIISQCRQDMFDVFNPINITRLRRDTHKSLHTLFTDENGHIHEPKLQRKKLLEITAPVISEQVQRKLMEILEIPDELFYKKEIQL